MMKDWTGKRFGKREITRTLRSSYVAYRCDCGHVGETYISNARRCSSCPKCHNGGRKHGLARSLEYGVWVAMIQRTTNPKCDMYWRYGGRGIGVSDRWRKFENFIADMGRRPTSEHTLERKNNSKGYEKRNCCWATRAEQHRNRSSSRCLTLAGKTLTVNEWARELRMSPSTIHNRLRKGWSVERVLDSSSIRDTIAHQRLLDAVSRGAKSGRSWLRGVQTKTEASSGHIGRRGRMSGPPRKPITLGIKLSTLKTLDSMCKRFQAHRTAVVDAAIELFRRSVTS